MPARCMPSTKFEMYHYDQEWAKERERRIRNGINPDAPLVTYSRSCPLCTGECKGHTGPTERNIVLGIK